jgi:inosine-uridine nucleoside N-ribohydrolase
VKDSKDFYCAVETQGALTRGMMIVDHHFLQQKRSNATIITELDKSLYESMLIWAAGGPDYKSLRLESFEMHYW